MQKKTGDFVQKDEPLAVLYASGEEKLQAGEKRFLEALTFSESKPDEQPLCFGTVE